MSNTTKYKLILIGELGVGKASIITRFTNGTFDPNTVTPSITPFFRKNVDLPDGEAITFDIWDPSGQEKYRSLTRFFYKDARAIVLVYDVTNKNSFNEIKNFQYEETKQVESINIVISIAANKYDLYEQKQVSNEEGEEFAKSIGSIFVSTSAKNASSINALFENIAHKIIDPNFETPFFEPKNTEEYKRKKKKEKAEEDDNTNKGMKLTSHPEKKEKKKGFC